MLQYFEEHIRTVKRLLENSAEEIQRYADLVSQKIRSGRTVFFCGNGGSAAECQHMAAELVGRFLIERKG